MKNTARSRWRPYLAIDELDVGRALGVAVARAILCASLVAGEPGQATILVHLREVYGTVETARQLADINIERDLLVQEVEETILGIRGHQVETGTDVLAVVIFGDKLELQRTRGRRRDAVGLGVISTIDGAVARARLSVWASSGIPLVAVVAVGIAGCDVRPPPVGLSRRL